MLLGLVGANVTRSAIACPGASVVGSGVIPTTENPAAPPLIAMLKMWTGAADVFSIVTAVLTGTPSGRTPYRVPCASTPIRSAVAIAEAGTATIAARKHAMVAARIWESVHPA